jgi:Protein of unknown function (DUF1579)
MAQVPFKESIESGEHSRLAKLAGAWRGPTKVWFKPNELGDESETRATFKPVLGGRFMLCEYTGTMGGKPLEGIALYGYSLEEEKYQMAWVDSAHMGTGILFSENNKNTGKFAVTGSWGTIDMPERWGWRTELELAEDGNTLIITAYNITPQGQEAKATETILKRL